MPSKYNVKLKPPADPVGDVLVEVYLFLLRKAAERRQATSEHQPSASDPTPLQNDEVTAGVIPPATASSMAR